MNCCPDCPSRSETGSGCGKPGKHIAGRQTALPCDTDPRPRARVSQSKRSRSRIRTEKKTPSNLSPAKARITGVPRSTCPAGRAG
jgi:hypothetical protein